MPHPAAQRHGLAGAPAPAAGADPPRADATAHRQPEHTLARLGPAADAARHRARDARGPGPAAGPLAQFILVPEAPPHAGAAVSVCSALYGLTPAEAALLPLLLQGMTPREMADNRHVKMPTVRSQLASLYAKTGTRGVMPC